MNSRQVVGILFVLAGAGIGITSAFSQGVPELKAITPLLLWGYPIALGSVILGLWQLAKGEEEQPNQDH